ncbi:MAG: APC family permease [Planctomycetota bacterium]
MTEPSKPSPYRAPQATNEAAGKQRADGSVENDQEHHHRTLSLFDCVCIIIGTIIGAGIFQLPSSLANIVPSSGWMIGMWLVGGAIALIGALCFAELTTTYPDRGGDYGYLKRAFGRRVGFAFSWAAFWVIRPGNISVMAIVFGIYARDAFTPSIPKAWYAMMALVVVSGVNLFGLKAGKWSQNLLAVAKVTGILVILLTAIAFVPAQDEANEKDTPANVTTPSDVTDDTSQANDSEPSNATETTAGDTESSVDDNEQASEEKAAATSFHSWFWLSLVLVMFAFGGWNDIAFVASEVERPQVNLFRSLLLGTLGVLAIYLLFNTALLFGMGMDGLASHDGSNAPTEFVAQRLGEIGGRFLATLVCVSCVGAVSAMIFTSPRIYWATAKDYPSLKWLAGDHNGWRRSMLLQTVVTAIFIAVFGGYESSFDVMVTASAPYFWSFLGLTVVSLMVLRQRYRGTGEYQNGFRVWYPFLPILFVVVCGFMSYRATTFMISQGFGWHAAGIGGWIVVGLISSLMLQPVDQSSEKSS